MSAQFFLNLAQTEGPAVAVSVRTFVDRYAALSAPADSNKFGAEAPKALELIVSRGVTAAVIAEAQSLLTALTQVAPAETLPTTEQQQQDIEQAEAAMWAWYLEWSQIARVAIKQRSLLRELGFLATRGPAEDEPPAPEPVPEPSPAAGSAVVTAAPTTSGALVRE